MRRDRSGTVCRRRVAAFECDAVDYLVHDVILYHLRYEAHAIIRTPAQVATGLSDGISVQLHRRGSIRGAVGEVDLYAAPDRIVLQDLAHPFSVWTDDAEVIGVIVPRRADRLSRLDPHPRAGHHVACRQPNRPHPHLRPHDVVGRASTGRDVGRTAARELVRRAPQWPPATESRPRRRCSPCNQRRDTPVHRRPSRRPRARRRHGATAVLLLACDALSLVRRRRRGREAHS